MQGKTVLGTGTLSSGSATFITSTLKAGTHAVTQTTRRRDLRCQQVKTVKQVVN